MKYILVFLTTLVYCLTAEECLDYLLTCPEMEHLCEESNIKSECPLTCGVCIPDPNKCLDHNPDCPTFSFACFTYKKQCPKTCGVCNSKYDNSTTPTLAPKVKTTVILSTLLPVRKTAAPIDVTTMTVKPATTKLVPTTTIRTTAKKTTVTLNPTVRPTTKKAGPTTPKPPCVDSSPNCPTWSKNGFCTNTFYPPEQRKQYCAKTCKFC